MRRPDPGPIVLGLCLATGAAAAQPGPDSSAPPPGTAAETPAPAAKTASTAPPANEQPLATGAPAPSSEASPPSVAPSSPVPEPGPAKTARMVDDAGGSAAEPAADPAARPAAPRIPPAEDLISGHGYFSALALLAVPFGSLERGLPWYDVGAPGLGAGVDLSIGASRNVSLGVWADLATLGAGPECDGCSTLTLSLGPLVRYHLVQGMRFDPQVAFGIGFRSMATRGAGRDLDYLGLDWLRFSAGGQWYATPNLAFAPFVAVAAGAAVRLPDSSPIRLTPGEDRRSGVYGLTLLGLRLTFDAPGR